MDAVPEASFPASSETVGRLVDEIVAGDDFVLRKVVDRLAHPERAV